jgi:hypothetical protein
MGLSVAARPVSAHGFAVPTVLWLLAALSVIVFALANSARTQGQFARSEWDRAAIEARLDAALQLTAALLQQGADPNYREHLWTIDGKGVTVRVTPATGLVDPNVASVAADYVHWRNQYRGRWEDPEQFLTALNLPREAHDKIKPYLGFSGQTLLDPRAAPPELLVLLSGVALMPSLVPQMVAQGQDPVVAGVLDSALFAPLAQRTEPLLYRMEAQLVDGERRVWRHTWWVDRHMRPDTRHPWTVERVSPLRVVAVLSDE